jgi:hypothetical protein
MTLQLRFFFCLMLSIPGGLRADAQSAWPAVETLPAFPGIRRPSDPGFPGLPEVLRHFDFENRTPMGAPVADPLDWWQNRRPEILSMLRHYMYGHEPPAPADLSFSLISIDPEALGGLATKKVLTGTHGPAGRAPFRLVLYLPKGHEGPFPTLLALNREGDEHIEPPNGSRRDRWDLISAMARGVAIATVSSNHAFASDNNNFANHLIQPFANAGFEGDWKTISAWAWGLSRVMDYLVNDPEIDPFRVGVTGYSRRGKTALWAGALDDRFALVIPHQSGHGGAHSSRRLWGGTFGTQFTHWFLDSYTYLGGSEYDRLPFDQHFVMALSAPRRVLLSENSSYGDNYDGMLGQKRAARPVWELLGADSEAGLRLIWDTNSAHRHAPEHWADAYDAVLDLPHGGLEGFRRWAVGANGLPEDAPDAQVRQAMRQVLPGTGVSALETYWLGLEEGDGFAAGIHVRAGENGRMRLILPQRRDGIGLAGQGGHWRGIEQWLEVAESLAGPWRTVPPERIRPLQWLDSGHDHAVHVELEDESADGGAQRFYRIRYSLRYGDEPLLLISHPQHLTVFEGDSATFTAQVRGSGILETDWWFNGTPIPGAGGTFHTVTNVQPADAGEYRFRALTAEEEIFSLPAMLTVIPNTNAAVVVHAEFISSEIVQLTFSEPVAAGTGEAGAENPSLYRFTDGITVVSASLLADTVTLLLAVEGASLGQTGTLTVGGIANRAATPVVSPIQHFPLRQNSVARINFQPDTHPVPTGWLGDHGNLYGDRGNGFTYGWSAQPGTTRQRNFAVSPDYQHDSLIHAGPQEFFDDPDWSISLPNGTYVVRLVMGDAQYYNNTYEIHVQGQVLVAGTTHRDLRWIEGTREVDVTDGTLTLSKGPGARRNKLNFVEIFIRSE